MTDKTEMAAKLQTITPQDAKNMLMSNVGNRPVRSRTLVKKISRAISAGKWAINGATIRISKQGRVLDGQHRLNAIVDSGVAVQTFVIYGLDDDCFHTIDTDQATRTTSDVFAIRGEKNYTALAAALRLAYLWIETGDPYSSNANVSPSPWQLESLFDSIPSIERSVDLACTKYRPVTKLISKSPIAFCHYAFSVDYADEADSFFDRLSTGVGLAEKSPILLLRERLIDSRSSKETMTARYKMALVFKAFRLYKDGALITYLRIRESGNAVEKNLFQV